MSLSLFLYSCFHAWNDIRQSPPKFYLNDLSFEFEWNKMKCEQWKQFPSFRQKLDKPPIIIFKIKKYFNSNDLTFSILDKAMCCFLGLHAKITSHFSLFFSFVVQRVICKCIDIISQAFVVRVVLRARRRIP